jgi:dihydroneopterin aldolase
LSDEILLEGLRFFGYHGLHPEERILGQRFSVDVRMEVNLRKPGASDRIEDTVNYSSVFTCVRSVLEGESKLLIEALADEAARKVLEQFPAVTAIELTVRKLGATIRGSQLDSVGARVRRKQTQAKPVQRVKIRKATPSV